MSTWFLVASVLLDVREQLYEIRDGALAGVLLVFILWIQSYKALFYFDTTTVPQDLKLQSTCGLQSLTESAIKSFTVCCYCLIDLIENELPNFLKFRRLWLTIAHLLFFVTEFQLFYCLAT